MNLKMAFSAIRRLFFGLKPNGINARILKNILLYGCYLVFEELIFKKKKNISVYILKPCREMGQRPEESYEEVTLVKR